MKKFFMVFFIVLLGIFAFAGEFDDLLKNADTYKISEKIFTFGKGYEISINNKKVAEINGKFIKIFGDVFSINYKGKTPYYEEESKKMFRFSWDRLALVYNEKKQPYGYLAEKRFQDLFKWGLSYHILDINGKELGYTDEVIFTIFRGIIIRNSKGFIEYDIQQEFSFINHVYTIRKNTKNPQINPVYALFLCTIFDAIKDDDEAKRNKKKNK